MAKPKDDIRTEKLKLYDRLISTVPEQKRKGKTSAYTSLNGHMFSFLDKNNEFSFRFSEPEKKTLMEKYGAKESIQYNSVMRGYIVVPEEIENDFDKLSDLFHKSFEYIKTLKPKPSKKNK